eukprot:GHVP01010013.1.p1 GENE.GHVP01010013.1~~GHVP01010013.1.p1  ORF type:complete len:881 (+),score=120.46 GHVP01010013.1:87-2729(+)
MVRSPSSSSSPSLESQDPNRCQPPEQLRKQKPVKWKRGRHSKVLKVSTSLNSNDSSQEIPFFRSPVKELIYKDLIPSSYLNNSSNKVPSSSSSNTPSSAASNLPSSAASNLPSSATSNLPSSAASKRPSSAASNLPSSAASKLPSSAASKRPSSALSNSYSSTASNILSFSSSNGSSSSISNNSPSAASRMTYSAPNNNRPSSSSSNSSSSSSNPPCVSPNSTLSLSSNTTCSATYQAHSASPYNNPYAESNSTSSCSFQSSLSDLYKMHGGYSYKNSYINHSSAFSKRHLYNCPSATNTPSSSPFDSHSTATSKRHSSAYSHNTPSSSPFNKPSSMSTDYILPNDGALVKSQIAKSSAPSRKPSVVANMRLTAPSSISPYSDSTSFHSCSPSSTTANTPSSIPHDKPPPNPQYWPPQYLSPPDSANSPQISFTNNPPLQDEAVEKKTKESPAPETELSTEGWVERMRQFQIDQMSRRIGRPKLDRSQTSCFCCRARKTSQWRYLESFLDLSLESGNQDTSLQLFRLCVCNACWLRVTKMWKKRKTCTCKPRESCSHLQLAVPKILKEVLSNTKFSCWTDSQCDSELSERNSMDEKFAYEVAMSSLTPISKPSPEGVLAQNPIQLSMSAPIEKNNLSRLCDSLPLPVNSKTVAPDYDSCNSEAVKNSHESGLTNSEAAAREADNISMNSEAAALEADKVPMNSEAAAREADNVPMNSEAAASSINRYPSDTEAARGEDPIRIAPGTLALDTLPFLVLRSLQEKHQLPLDEESDALLKALYPDNTMENLNSELELNNPQPLHYPDRVGRPFEIPSGPTTCRSYSLPPGSSFVPPPSCVEFARALSRGEKFENRVEESYISPTGERVLVVSFSWKTVPPISD